MPLPAPQKSTPDSTLIPGDNSLKSGYDALPRIVSVDDSTGCTLTKAHIKGLTPREFEDLSNKETDLARVIASSAEAKMLGVEERGLTALLTSSVQNIKPLINKVNVAEQSIILPYIQRRQRSVINANYFAISAGSASGGTYADGVPSFPASGLAAGTGSSPTYTSQSGDWVVSVNLGGSDWKSPISDIERYFLPGSFVVVNHWDSATKAAVEVQFMVMGAAPDTSIAGVTQAKVTLRPTGKDVPSDNSQWATFEATVGDNYKPTTGVLQTLANNVNDYEAWCRNQPTDLSVRLLVNWLQTSRESREVNEEYKDTLAAIMSGKVNPYLRSMVYQPLAEQNKLASKLSQDQWTRAVWYNQALNDKQTPESYMQLPGVHDPEDTNCTLEYKAQALGIKSLLREAARVTTAGTAGGALDLDKLMSDLYYLKRNREQDGTTVSVIDCMTDRMTSVKIFEAFNKYYATRYGWTLERNSKIGETIEHNGVVLFNYNIYDLPDIGCQLAVFHDPMFDDLLNVGAKFNLSAAGGYDAQVLEDGTTQVFSGDNATSDSDFNLFKATSRTLWLVDWSDVKIGVAGTNSVTRTQPHPEVDRLYSCRMDSVKRTFNLRSTKWTTMVDRPHRHLIIENFNDQVTLGGTTY